MYSFGNLPELQQHILVADDAFAIVMRQQPGSGLGACFDHLIILVVNLGDAGGDGVELFCREFRNAVFQCSGHFKQDL